MSNFYDRRTYSKFTVLVHFWAQFTPEKSKIMSKTKISPETAFLGVSINTSFKSQINLRILIKLIKKPPFFGPKMG